MHITTNTCTYNIKNSRVRVIDDGTDDRRGPIHASLCVEIKGHLISWLWFGESSFRGRLGCLTFRKCRSQNAASFLPLVSH